MHIYTDDLRHCIYMPEATLMVRQDNDVCTEYYTSAHSYHISKGSPHLSNGINMFDLLSCASVLEYPESIMARMLSQWLTFIDDGC